jgi:hypothetical protein
VYRCEARSVSAFIRHLAVNYVSRGYFFYVQGEVPAHKDPARTDARIIEKYGLDISKWTRARQRKQGRAGVQYLRCRRRFVIVATHGDHPFFQEEGGAVLDVRRVALKFGGYSISYRLGWREKWFVSVRIEYTRFLQLKEYLLNRARRSSMDELLAEVRTFSFPAFAPVRKQIFILLLAINRVRKLAGTESIPLASVLPRNYRRDPLANPRESGASSASPHSSSKRLQKRYGCA